MDGVEAPPIVPNPVQPAPVAPPLVEQQIPNSQSPSKPAAPDPMAAAKPKMSFQDSKAFIYIPLILIVIVVVGGTFLIINKSGSASQGSSTSMITTSTINSSSSVQKPPSSYISSTISSNTSSVSTTTIVQSSPCHCLSLAQIEAIFNGSVAYKNTTSANLNVTSETISSLRQSSGPLYPSQAPTYILDNITSSWSIAYTVPYNGDGPIVEPVVGLSVETKGSANALFNYAVNDTALENSGTMQADEGGTVHGGYYNDSNGLWYDYVTFGNSRQITIIAYKGNHYIQMTLISDSQLQPNFILSQLNSSM
jgi:hypothetical protein